MKRIIGFRNAGFAYRDPPPRYTEEDVNDRRYVEAEVPTKRYTEAEENNKRAVEVAAPPPNPFFEPVERQRHFGILRYTVNNRFRKLMIIGICNFILITLVLLIIGFLVFEFGFKHKGTATPSTTTMKVQIRTAIKQITTKPVSTGSTTTSRATKGDTTTVTTTSTSSSTGTSSTTTSSSTVTTTTTQPTTSTKKIIEQSSNCSPLDQSTFLFSYSNDFDSATVLDAFNYFFERTGSDDHFNKLANIRFDMKTQDEFEFHSDWSDFQSSVQSNLPNTSLALFKTVGSDVLDMINRFLENDQVSICGSRIFVLTKRYPNEMDTTELVSKLRQFHVELTFVASRNSCGSWNPDVLCNLALRTNGHTFFDDDDQIFYGIRAAPSFYDPYPIYAVNPIVSGNGTIQLSQLFVAEQGDDFWFTITVQDNNPTNVVQTVLLRWSGWGVANQFGISGGDSGEYSFFGNHVTGWKSLGTGLFNVALDYQYSDTVPRTLQIRVHKKHSTIYKYWPPYD